MFRLFRKKAPVFEYPTTQYEHDQELYRLIEDLNQQMYYVSPDLMVWNHPPDRSSEHPTPQQFEVLTKDQLKRRMRDRDV